MSKYNLTDILNEYVGGSRIGTYPSTAMDLVRTMDDLESNNPNLEIRRTDGSGDGKTSISFTVVEKGQDQNKPERGFTVYDYKVGDWVDERGEYEGAMDFPDMDVDFSIGGNDLNMALELLPGAVEYRIGEEKMSSEEEIENIKRMNPRAEERYLKRIAKMGKSKAVKTGEKMGFDMRGIDENVYIDGDEARMQLDQYRKGNIDGDDLANAFEELVFGDVKAPTDEVMGIDRLGREKAETEPTDLSRAKMKLREKEVEYYPETFIDIATSYMKKRYDGRKLGTMGDRQLERLGQKIVDTKYDGDARLAYEELVDDKHLQIREGFVKHIYTVLSDYGTPMEINAYMDSLGNEFRLSPTSKIDYEDFSEDDWVEDFRNYISDKSLQEHFKRFNIKKYS